MHAKLDENLPVEAAELLRTAGWQCDTVYDEGLVGADDPEVAAACQAGARVLFTLDLDFAISGHTCQASTSASSWAELTWIGSKERLTRLSELIKHAQGSASVYP